MRFVLVCAHSQVMLLLHTPHVQDKCLCKPSQHVIHMYAYTRNMQGKAHKLIM